MEFSIEENVKIKIVLEFLKSLGFREDELSFEKSFLLDLGRSTYKVDTEEQCRKAQPRLDILVTRNNKNLFVVEVKSDLVTVSEKEVEQATSYARLVHPVAPFTIVTNGKEFYIYNSLTRTEIEKDKFKIREHYEVTLPDNYRYEALKHFIGYSKENLRIFCQNQVLEGMRTLLGSKRQPYKKFIPDLHTPRKKLRTAFENFMHADKPAFAILGDSGTGKTCSMCSMALELMKHGRPVLFYRANDLVDGIIKSIADDFNWEFTSQYYEIEVFKRIDDLFESNKLVIFIDAIDEWNLPNKVEILNRFLAKISSRNFKVVLSCKTNAWDNFLQQKGTPTYVSEAIYTTKEHKTGHYLDPLDPKEFHESIKRYREFYHFKGLFEDKVLEECKKTPFLLRVFFEVAQKFRLKHLTFSSIEFFHEYYKLTLKKVGNQQVADATLKGVAECLFNQNSDSIDIDIVRDALGLKVNDLLLPELFEYNVLEQTFQGTLGKVRFYFNKFRDYIIAFHVMIWQDALLPEFSSAFKRLKSSGVHQDAISFFYPFASIDKKRAIDEVLRNNAEKYLDFYIKVIEDNFLNFRDSFSPYTKGDIGFIGELLIPEVTLGMYGFRQLIDPSEERIKFIPVDRIASNTNIGYLHGAQRLHMTASSNGFRELNIEEEVLRNEVEKQLKDIIGRGLLNEKNNTYLLIEKIIAIIVEYQANHHGIKNHGKLSQHLPIDFEAIEYALRYERAFRYYEDKLIQEKREKGIIKETWHGSTVSYSYSLSSDDWAWIRDQAEHSAKKKIDVKSEIRYADFDKMEKTLSEALYHLRNQNIYSIKELIVPDQDTRSASRWIWGDYSYNRLIDYILRLYRLFLTEYKKLIETNFASLKNHFKLYSSMPIKCFIVTQKSSEDIGLYVDLYTCHNQETEKNEVTLCSRDELTVDYKQWNLIHLNKNYKLITHGQTYIDHFFGSDQTYTDFRIPYRLATLRNLVYRRIQAEIDKVLNHLFDSYGVQRK